MHHGGTAVIFRNNLVFVLLLTIHLRTPGGQQECSLWCYHAIMAEEIVDAFVGQAEEGYLKIDLREKIVARGSFSRQ
jgi:hypothetical protein